MKMISPKLHSFLDYVTVIFLFLSPLLFSMTGTFAICVYVLATVQAMLSLLTDYDYGVFKLVPFTTHGWIEIIIAAALTAGAVFFRSMQDMQGFYYCAGLALIYLLVPLFTRFRAARPHGIAVIL